MMIEFVFKIIIIFYFIYFYFLFLKIITQLQNNFKNNQKMLN
jgi:hypothetical protein